MYQAKGLFDIQANHGSKRTFDMKLVESSSGGISKCIAIYETIGKSPALADYYVDVIGCAIALFVHLIVQKGRSSTFTELIFPPFG